MDAPDLHVEPLPETAVADVASMPVRLDEWDDLTRGARRSRFILSRSGPPTPVGMRWSPGELHAWSEERVATDLAPVRWNYFTRFHLLTERSVAGKRPNAAFNTVYNEADAHWRLMDATGAGLPMDAERAEQWLNAAQSASLLGLDQLLTETLARAPGLATVRAAADFALSPSIKLEADRRGKLRIGHETGGTEVRKARMAEADLAPQSSAPRPKAGMGVGWRLPDEDAAPADDSVQWGAWVDVENVGLSNLRGELSFEDLSWSLSARRKLVPDLFVIGTVRSTEVGPDPARWSVGALATSGSSGRWNVRFERSEAVRDGEVTWMVTFRSELGAWMPGQLDPTRFGMPNAPQYSPNELDRWGERPI